MVANSPAQAALLADSVRGQLGSNSFSILDETAVVTDPGTEFSRVIGDGSLSLDVKSDSFDIIYDVGSFPSVGAPTTWILSDLDWVDTPGIVTGVTLASGDASLISGMSFTDDSITIDIINYSVPPQNQIETWTFDIQTEHESTPEPATILGLLTVTGLGLGSRLKRNVG
ncbi:MAG: PEP-CTERM sorting domain-containing protein [Okeania sp. SIO3C4]|nr:PEP-CTERM sorting domain-containing protein [Okeania sp. SIO3C4]